MSSLVAERPLTRGEVMALLTREQKQMLIDRLGEPLLRAAIADPSFNLRPLQRAMWDTPAPNGKRWRFRVIKGGRALGKNHAGRAATTQAAMEKGYGRLAAIARVREDIPRTFIEGPTGFAHLPPHLRPEIKRSPYSATFPNGARLLFYSADNPDAIRSLSADWIWADEMAAYKTSKAPPGEVGVSVWDNITLAVREKGRHSGARLFVTTTPRNRAEFRALIHNPAALVTTETTFANAANLSDAALDDYRSRFMFQDSDGEWQFTRTGLQEVKGDLLEDIEGALWSGKEIEAARKRIPDKHALAAACERIIVAIDPAKKVGEDNDYTGVVVAGLIGARVFVLESHGYRAKPPVWAARVAALYAKWNANEIIIEDNALGDAGEFVLQSANSDMRITRVVATSDKDKMARALPAHSLYEQGRVWHCSTNDPERENDHGLLEDQMAMFTGDKQAGVHDDMVDALAYAVNNLVTNAPTPIGVLTPSPSDFAAAMRKAEQDMADAMRAVR